MPAFSHLTASLAANDDSTHRPVDESPWMRVPPPLPPLPPPPPMGRPMHKVAPAIVSLCDGRYPGEHAARSMFKGRGSPVSVDESSVSVRKACSDDDRRITQTPGLAAPIRRASPSMGTASPRSEGYCRTGGDLQSVFSRARRSHHHHHQGTVAAAAPANSQRPDHARFCGTVTSGFDTPTPVMSPIIPVSWFPPHSRPGPGPHPDREASSLSDRELSLLIEQRQRDIERSQNEISYTQADINLAVSEITGWMVELRHRRDGL